MRVIDLSRPLADGMQVFPGDAAPRVSDAAEFDKDGYREKLLTISSHTGTHMDAPAHMLEDGKTLDQLPAETYFGFGIVADVRKCAGREIAPADLGLSETQLMEADFLLLRSGWDEKFGTPEYYEDYPVLSAETARMLAAEGLKGIGFDAISADPVISAGSPVHKTLLGAGLVLIENLTGLALLPAGETFCLSALPMAIEDADGAPARVMAVLEK